ncbi:hypothetical protein [Staphylococcus sp. GDX8P80P]|uniref:hypothetical protein n=1 Tax=Staphylococcus sp. GDX8P80P TaxID=2804104 RepID=UPI001AEBC8C2|nr:hypothetical protein [Staphylococcus sp. GDX8P80P]
MNELQESTLKDLALCIKASQMVDEQNNIIEKENIYIRDKVIKNIRRNALIYRLVIFILFFLLLSSIYLKFRYVLLGLIVYIIYFIRIKKYSKNNPAFLNSMKYSFTRNRLIHKNHFTSSINRINEANKVKNEVATVLNDIDIYKRIPEKYCNAYAAAKMYDYFLTYRADNLKEAINLFELEEHQSRLEAKQDYIIKQNDQIQIDVLASRYASELAARESQKAKSTASTASFISFMNLLKK